LANEKTRENKNNLPSSFATPANKSGDAPATSNDKQKNKAGFILAFIKLLLCVKLGLPFCGFPRNSKRTRHAESEGNLQQRTERQSTVRESFLLESRPYSFCSQALFNAKVSVNHLKISNYPLQFLDSFIARSGLFYNPHCEVTNSLFPS